MKTDISVLLTEQARTLDYLKSIIQQEKKALIRQQAEALLTLAEEKNNLLSQLQSRDQQLAAHPDTKLLSSTYIQKVQSVKDKLAHCQQLNDANAKLIDMNLASISRFTQALQISRNANSLTYDGKGKTSTIATLGNNLKA